MINLLLAATLSLFHYVNVPVAEMRELPDSAVEINSQAYFSEPVNILEESGDWVKIETTVDGYRGWAKKNALCQREQAFLSDPSSITATVNRLAVHLYHVEDTTYGPIITIPFESRLEVLEPKQPSESRWIKVALVDGRQAYVQRGDVSLSTKLLSRNEMCLLSMRFLDLPYTWGGRSSFGYDCSGFVQMLYRQMGIFLPRDSKDQMRWEGFDAIALDELRAGDLIFFGPAEDKIRHVAMSLGDERFIHSVVRENAPYLRISRLSDAFWNGTGEWSFRTARTLKK